MRQIPAYSLATRNDALSYFIQLWRITRKDGVVLAFTNHSEDLPVGGIVFKSTPSFSPTDITWNSDLSVDNMEIQSVFQTGEITENDIYGGKYDGAVVDIAEWDISTPVSDPSYPTSFTPGQVAWLRTGVIGEIRSTQWGFTVEIRGLMQKLAQVVGEVTTPWCRATFGDARCTINLATAASVDGIAITWTNLNVDNIIAGRTISCAALTPPENFFADGYVQFTTGNATGVMAEISTSLSGQIVLYEQPAISIQVGDKFTAVAGCDKLLATCNDKWNNVLNFRGEPHVPGYDAIYAGFVSGHN